MATPALRLIDPQYLLQLASLSCISVLFAWTEKRKNQTGLVCFLRVTLLLSLLQEFWRLTAPRAPLYLLAATHQNRPPPPSSSSQWSSRCTGPRGAGTTSSPWEDWATWLPARTVAVGPSGASRRLQQRTLFVSAFLSWLFHFFPTTGRPCWTVKMRAQETSISPCWRAPLHSHSQMKVWSHSTCHPRECNVCLAHAAMTTSRKKQPVSLAGTLKNRRKRLVLSSRNKIKLKLSNL